LLIRRTKSAAEALRKSGFSQVYDLQGGYLKWTTKMKPVEGTSATKDAKAITDAELEAILAQHSVVILDFLRHGVVLYQNDASRRKTF
jgi:3-mercaptopyruvate sulfurtransferase SseA